MATPRADTIRALVSVWLAACGGQGPRPSVTAPTPPSPTPAEAPSAADSTEPRFQMTRAMIPMRDGVSLETLILSPSPLQKPLPMLLVRTPYGIPKDDHNLRSEWYAP